MSHILIPGSLPLTAALLRVHTSELFLANLSVPSRDYTEKKREQTEQSTIQRLWRRIVSSSFAEKQWAPPPQLLLTDLHRFLHMIPSRRKHTEKSIASKKSTQFGGKKNKFFGRTAELLLSTSRELHKRFNWSYFFSYNKPNLQKLSTNKIYVDLFQTQLTIP